MRNKLFIFDLDGTLCDCWYAENSIGLYKDGPDMVLRSIDDDTYRYARPIKAAQDLIQEIRKNEGIVKVLTRTVAGHEYVNKVNFLTKYYGIEQEQVIGVLSEDEKVVYINAMMHSGKYEGLCYFDDSIAFLSVLRNDCILEFDGAILENIKLFHSSSIINRTFEELVRSDNIFAEYL